MGSAIASRMLCLTVAEYVWMDKALRVTSELISIAREPSVPNSTKNKCLPFYEAVQNQCKDFWAKQHGYEDYSDDCNSLLEAAWTGKIDDPVDLRSLMYPLFAELGSEQYPRPTTELAGSFPASVFWTGFSHGRKTRWKVDAFAAAVGARDVEHPGTALGRIVRNTLWSGSAPAFKSSGPCHASKQDATWWVAISKFFGIIPALTSAASSLEFYLLINDDLKTMLQKKLFLYEHEVPFIGKSCSNVAFCRIVFVDFTDSVDCEESANWFKQKIRQHFKPTANQQIGFATVCSSLAKQPPLDTGEERDFFDRKHHTGLLVMQTRATEAVKAIQTYGLSAFEYVSETPSVIGGECSVFYSAILRRCRSYWLEQANFMHFAQRCESQLAKIWNSTCVSDTEGDEALRVLGYPLLLPGNSVAEVAAHAPKRLALWSGFSRTRGTKQKLNQFLASMSSFLPVNDLEHENHGIGAIIREVGWMDACHKSGKDDVFWRWASASFLKSPMLIPGLSPALEFFVFLNYPLQKLTESFLFNHELKFLGETCSTSKPRVCKIIVIDFKEKCSAEVLGAITARTNTDYPLSLTCGCPGCPDSSLEDKRLQNLIDTSDLRS